MDIYLTELLKQLAHDPLPALLSELTNPPPLLLDPDQLATQRQAAQDELTAMLADKPTLGDRAAWQAYDTSLAQLYARLAQLTKATVEAGYYPNPRPIDAPVIKVRN